MFINENKDFESISQLIKSGLLGKSRKQIMRMISDGVDGKRLQVERSSFPFDDSGNRYFIKRNDAIRYAKYLDGLK